MSVWTSKFWSFIARAFSDEHGPSSSRIISSWLSVSSMSLLWWVVRHMQGQPVDKLTVWAANLPMVIAALATFSTAPYGVMKLSSMFKKDNDKASDTAENKEDK